MKNFKMIFYALLLNICWLQAQEYTDVQIGFERAHIEKELSHHGELNPSEIKQKMEQLRTAFVERYVQSINSPNGNSRVGLPTPVTSSENMDFSQNTNLWTLNMNRLNYGVRPSQDNTPNGINSWGIQGAAGLANVIDPFSNISRFQVIPASTIDPRLNSPVNRAAPLGANVLRMGDPNEFPDILDIDSDEGQEEVSKSYVLTADNSVLRYGYAIIFEQIAHQNVPNSFDIFISVNGVPLDGCTEINFSFNDAMAGNGFVPSAINPLDLVRPWTTNTIDLLSVPGVQLGDIITIAFRVRDCGFTIHGSYAYISAEALPSEQAITSTSASGDLCVDEVITFTTDVDILAGSTTFWEITDGTNVINTFPNGGASINDTFMQPGTYTVNFSMTSPGGCTINSSTMVDIEECCPDCNEVGDDIMNGITPVATECGAFRTKITPEMLECYTIQINIGDGSGYTTITSSDVTNSFYEWNYTENQTYLVVVRLIDPETGNVCYFKRKKFDVKCCFDCNATGDGILNSIGATSTCGKYIAGITEHDLNCFDIDVNIGDGSGWVSLTSGDISNDNYFFSYTENDSYIFQLRMTDLTTGLECYNESITLEVSCFEEFCVEDPILEDLLANQLMNILNAIVDNGFTSRCGIAGVVDITTLPEVVQFIQIYDLQNRLQNAIDIRENLPFNSYPYYTANITDVYYSWGDAGFGRPPCLTITFANQPFAQQGPRFSYFISGGYDNGVPNSTIGLNPNLIDQFTDIDIDVAESKATFQYVDNNGQTQSLYDILWPMTAVQGSISGLRYCWFHDLNFTPETMLDDTQNKVDLKIHPNPVTDRFSLEFTEEGVVENYDVTVQSMTGMTVYQSKRKNEKTILVDNWMPGIYFVKVVATNGTTFVERLIVK